MIFRRIMAMTVAAAASLGMSPGQAQTDNPVASSLKWFSYAGAEDFRDTCRPGGPDRLRLIYNAQYREHVRTYDINMITGTDDAMMEARARGTANLSIGLSLSDPFGPWRFKSSLRRLSAAEMTELKGLLRKSGFFTPASRRIRLNSNNFYWLATGCIDGKFHANGWQYPSSRFSGIQFPAFLFARDGTGLEVPPPEDINKFPSSESDRFRNDEQEGFEFIVDNNKVIGGSGIF